LNFLLEKKLDEQSLEILYQSIRSNKAWNTYSNEQIIDAILRKEATSNFDEFKYKLYLDYHRDSTPRPKLIAFANQVPFSSNDNNQYNPNIDTCDTVDIDIDDLIIKPWCSRFCSRCYTYK